MRSWLVVLVLCVVVFCQAFFSSFFLSATADEFPHIESGYSALTTGDFRMETEHPPFIKILSALPLLLLNLTFPIEHESWKQSRHFTFYKQFIFEANAEKADLILFLARIPMMLLAVSFVISVFFLTSRLFGLAQGLLAAFMAAFEPNILAQSNLVMTDLGFALFCFLYIGFLFLFLEKPSCKLLITTLALFGIVLLTKFTAVFLAPVSILLIISHGLMRHPLNFPWRGKQAVNIFFLLVLLAVTGVLFVNSAYLFSGSFTTLEKQFSSDLSIDKSIYNPDTLFFHPLLNWIYKSIPVPLPYHFVKGLGYVIFESHSPHKNFLSGIVHEDGFISYYLWSVLLKLPLPFLLLFLFSVTAGFLSKKRHLVVFFLIPIVFFIIIFSFSSKQNGLRYILQIIPFMILLASGFSKQLLDRKLYTVFFCTWFVIGSLIWFPNYLAFHNELVSSEKWPHIFADPNIETGQNLNALTKYLITHNWPDAQVIYEQKEDLRKYWPFAFKKHNGCTEGIIAVDTVSLHTNPQLSYLLCLKPSDIIRNSIFVYNMTGCMQ